MSDRPFESEAEKIERWRHDQILELVHDEGDAQWLALAGIDPHDLERLLGKGCPLDVAKKILAPV